MNYYQRQKFRQLISILVLISVFVTLLMTIKLLLFSPEREAKRAIKQFYEYEQKGNFSASWEMFHPYMKEKFSKGHYIQDRAHVFLNHFNIETFPVSYSKIDKLKKWQMSKNHQPLENVYKIRITKTINGKYGNFTIHQDVFTVKTKDKWTILWSYEK